MQTMTKHCSWVFLLIFANSACALNGVGQFRDATPFSEANVYAAGRGPRTPGIAKGGLDTRTIEIPTNKAGEVRVSEIVSRIATASGVTFELPAADLTLSTQGFAGPLTRTLLSDALGPEVAIAFRPGVMVMTIDERNLVAEKRNEWLGRLRNLGEKARRGRAQKAVIWDARLEVISGE